MIETSIKIGNLELKNRLVMPPVATYQSAGDGKVTEALVDYYSKRAAGGNIGLIITEHSFITKQGQAKKNQLSISDDSDVEGLSKLTAAIHQNGTRAMCQLNHAGAAAQRSITGMDIVSASSIPLQKNPATEDIDLPKELTKSDIETLKGHYVLAARRAKAAGFDGVEIHSAHAYLLNQFYSPLTNKRTDEYGGTLENRIRIHKEVIAAVRNEVGPDYPIALRLGDCDYMEGGSTIENCVEAALMLESYGIDMLDLSGGLCSYMREGHTEPGYFRDMTTPVTSKLTIPVMLTGGVTEISQADSLLEEKAADLIGVGRSLLKDATWADREMDKFNA